MLNDDGEWCWVEAELLTLLNTAEAEQAVFFALAEWHIVGRMKKMTVLTSVVKPVKLLRQTQLYWLKILMPGVYSVS